MIRFDRHVSVWFASLCVVLAVHATDDMQSSSRYYRVLTLE